MLQKSSIEQTLAIFFLSPTKDHYLMDISRTIGIAHTSVKKNLRILVRLGLLVESIEKKGGRKYPLYKARREYKLFRQYKMLYNLRALLESKVIDFIEEKVSPRVVVVFGSYRWGEDIENSDVDLFVECKEEKLDLHKFEQKLGRKIELHFNGKFTSYPKELKNNIINGIVIQGFLEGYS